MKARNQLNQAERDGRMMKLHQKISGRSMPGGGVERLQSPIVEDEQIGDRSKLGHCASPRIKKEKSILKDKAHRSAASCRPGLNETPGRASPLHSCAWSLPTGALSWQFKACRAKPRSAR